MPAQAQSGATGAESRWQVSEDDFLLLEITVKNYRFNYEVRGYQTQAGVCLDLADVIQSLDLPVRLDKKSRRATGWLFSEDQQFTIDRDSSTVQTMNIGSAPLSDDIIDTPEGWCIDTKALSRWFGITFTPDLYNAQVRLEGADDLPFLQAIERRSRAARLSDRKKAFDLSQFDRKDTEYKVWRTPSVDTVLRTNLRVGDGPTELAVRGEVYAAGEALGVSYNTRLATNNKFKPNSLRVTAFRQDPDGELLGPLKATHVAAGDVRGEAGRLTLGGSVGRGAFIGNKPLGRTSRFSTTDLLGILPGGWDAELYRNGQLIAFQDESEDGRYEFLDIDLYYGRNDLEVVLYGPQGQIRRENYSYPVGAANIEPGKTYYWANALQPDTDLITIDSTGPPQNTRWRYGAGLEHGIDERTSVLLATQSDFLALRRRTYLEGTLYRALGQMQVELAGAHEVGRGGVGRVGVIGRLGRVNLGADFTKVEGGYISEFITDAVDFRLGFNASTSLRLGSAAVPIQAGVARARLTNGATVTQVLANAGVALRRLAFNASFTHGQVDDPLTNENESDTRLSMLLSTTQWGIRLRGGGDITFSGDDKGIQTVRLGGEGAIDETSNLQADLRYLVRSGETNMTLGYAKRFDKFGLRSRVGYTSGGAWDFSLIFNMSIGPDPLYGGFRLSEQRLARQGQAAVRVFRDENGDGLFQGGEPLLEGVSISAGHRATDAETDASGRALVDGLRPYLPVLIGVDASSLDDPFLIPSDEGIVIVPRPGIPAELVLAVGVSGEVEGTVLSPAGVELAGVTLELVDERGAVIAETLSEFDGFFLFEKVPYGRYRLRVGSKASRALSMREEPGLFIEVNAENDIGRFGNVRLVPTAPTVAEAD